MALTATIYKAEVRVADVDRGHYAAYSLTLARHPSETDERLMVRLLAFCLNASATLRLGRGLSTEDEADLFDQDPTGQIEHWIDVGMPDARAIRKACGRARQVTVVAYGRAASAWWRQNGEALSRLRNLRVFQVPASESAGLAGLAARGMKVEFANQDGTVWFTCGDSTLEIHPGELQAAGS